jgi:hypothetical protein
LEATYRLQPYEMGDTFFKTLKDAFYDKAVSVTVEEIEDETARLKRFSGTYDEIQSGLAKLNGGEPPVHTLTMEQVEAMAQ